MATRGRKPKPTELKILEGNPGKRKLNKNEPRSEGLAVCPEWLDKVAKEEWQRVAPILERLGLLSDIDTMAFAGYCQSYARWVEAEMHLSKGESVFVTPKGYVQQTPWVSIAQNNLRNMLKFCEQYGLTPSSRARLSTKKDNEEVDEMEKLLSGE